MATIDYHLFKFFPNLLYLKWRRLWHGKLQKQRCAEALPLCVHNLVVQEVLRLYSVNRETLRYMQRSSYAWGPILEDMDRRWPEGGDWGRPETAWQAVPNNFCTTLRSVPGLPEEMKDPRRNISRFAALPDDRARCRAIGQYRIQVLSIIAGLQCFTMEVGSQSSLVSLPGGDEVRNLGIGGVVGGGFSRHAARFGFGGDGPGNASAPPHDDDDDDAAMSFETAMAQPEMMDAASPFARAIASRSPLGEEEDAGEPVASSSPATTSTGESGGSMQIQFTVMSDQASYAERSVRRSSVIDWDGSCMSESASSILSSKRRSTL